MTIEDLLSDLKKKIEDRLPRGITVSHLEFEGPQLVIYTMEPRQFADNGDMIRWLAKDLRKRIVVRPDPSVLADPEDAVGRINEIVPDESGVTNQYFDADTGEVLIEAEKPGLVIGRHGSTLREITKVIGWSPKVVRTPPLESYVVRDIRDYLRKHKEERKVLLKEIGRRIHRDMTSKDQWARLTTIGGCREVGRNCTMLSTPETRVLIDCGVSVDSGDEGSPYLYIPEVQPLDQIDAVVLTHAHLDHCGLIPLLFKYGYDGPLYMTPPTRDLMVLLQLDYIEIAGREGKKIPYDSSYIREGLKHTITLNYGDVTDIAPDMKITLHNAGHILGSSVVHFHIGDGLYNIVFTGDFKYERTLLFNPAVNEFPRLEALFMESTYGGSRDMQPSRREAEQGLQRVIKETLGRDGNVLIPAFSVGRSQEVMIVLEGAIRKGLIDDVPIYLDGMIWEATAIHTTYPEYLNNNLRDMIFHKGLNPFLSDSFKRVESSEMRRRIMAEERRCVILSTAGMMNGGPIMEYFRHFAPDERNTLVFVGYQAEGTLGRRIQKGRNEIPMPARMTENGKSETVRLNMRVVTVDGFSGHSDRQQLMDYVRRMNPMPNRVMMNHGDRSTCLELAGAVQRKFKMDAKAPMNLETTRLI